MLALLDKSPAQMPEAAAEMEIEVAQLLTPLTRYADWGGKYGIDNGAFSRFDHKAFHSLLERQAPFKSRCLFVTAPDVPFSAIRTLEAFKEWYPLICQWPVALVAQDGQENHEIPWKLLRGIFIGGSDKFKQSTPSEQIIKCAKLLGVNSSDRASWCQKLEVDSIDGTGITRYSKQRIQLTRGEPLLSHS